MLSSVFIFSEIISIFDSGTSIPERREQNRAVPQMAGNKRLKAVFITFFMKVF